MRFLLRACIALLALGVVAGVVLALALPRIASSDAVRERILRAGYQATGAEVGFEALSFGVFPPRLVVMGPRIRAPGPDGAQLGEAERIDLQLAWLPLLERTIVVDSLRVEGARLQLVRTEAGLQLPTPPRPPDASGAGAAEAANADVDPEEAGGGGFLLAVRFVELRHAQLHLEDRSVSPPVLWELNDVDATARGSDLTGPIALEIDARLGSGGRVTVKGSADLEGNVDLEIHLAAIDLAAAAPYSPEADGLTGRLTGDVRARGPVAAPSSVEADLTLEDAHVQLEDLTFQGRLRVGADLAGTEAGLAGPFEIDATQAHVAYGGFFEKPPGTEATATGRIDLSSQGDLDVHIERFKVRDFEAEARLQTGARIRLDLDADPFDLANVAPLLLPLASISPEGSVGLDAIRLMTSPFDLRGRIELPELRLRLEGEEPVTLQGGFVAEGTALRSTELVASVGGERVGIDAEITGLGGEARYRLRVSTENAEIRSLLGTLAGVDDMLQGPLTSSLDFSGPLGGAADPVRDLAGRAELAIGRGRLRGVSLLEGTVDRLGAFGEAALLLGAQRGGKTLQRFYGDEFDSITGTFEIADGIARSSDLRLVYRHYTVDLRGALGLLDESLDFTGKITISEEVDAALAGQESSPAPREKVIPLAAVRGTLRSPRIQLTRAAVVRLATSYASGGRRTKLEQKIDERLGEGSGKELIDALEGLLGGRRRE